MTPIRRILLASTTLLAMNGFNLPGQATTGASIILAQAAPSETGTPIHKKEKQKEPKKEAHPLKPPARAPLHKPAAIQQKKHPSALTHPGAHNSSRPANPVANTTKREHHLGKISKPAGTEPGKKANEIQRRSSQPGFRTEHPITREQGEPASRQITTEKRNGEVTPDAATATHQDPASVVTSPTKEPLGNRSTVAQPTKPRNASEFILRAGQRPARGLADLHRERQETHEGNRTIIHEGDRTIVREHNRVIISHNQAQRFAVGARDVRVEHRGNQVVTVFMRPDGVEIINITDRDGQLIRRLRRDRDGHQFVIIDNDRAETQPMFVDVPPPTFHAPRDRYIIDEDRADPDQIYRVFEEGPIERLDHRYTLEQVRYSHSLREYMPRVDVDINFDTGSWQLMPDQIGRLSVIAQALNRLVRRNPQEVFLIEGHTDAVGAPEDNLSLSDRRAESVAVALTEEFGVPPENLVTQGYGEQNLKVQTLGPERANRRVSIRRITPLIDRADR